MAFKLCMIGCGSFAQLCHGPAQQRLAQSDRDLLLAGCCDPDENRAREYRERFGFARHYAGPSEMLAREKPDAVIMAVPPSVTAATAAPVLVAGFPLLLEKPPGLTATELQQLIASAAGSHTPAQVAFNRRYMPVVRATLGLLEQEHPPGVVTRIDYEMVRADRWDEDFSTTAIHAIDALLLLARAPVAAVMLRYQPQHDRGRFAANIELDAEAAAGTHLSLRVLPVAGRNAETVRLHGIGRTIVVSIPASPLSSAEGVIESWSGGKSTVVFPDRGAEMVERMGIYGELTAFVDHVRHGQPLTPALPECRRQVAIMEAIRTRRTGMLRFESD